MFIYVFNESDCEKMMQAGFQYFREDKDMDAFIFLADSTGEHTIPEDIESVVTSMMTFHGATGEPTTGGGQNGTENDAAL